MKYTNPKYLQGGLPGAPGSPRNTAAGGYPTRTGRAPGTTIPGYGQPRQPGGGDAYPALPPNPINGIIGMPMPIGTPAPPSGLPDTTPYPIDENGNNIYPQPGDPGYTGPRPTLPPYQPTLPEPSPWQGQPPPDFAQPNPFPITPGPGRPPPPGIMPVPPRQYPPVTGGRPGWGARPWAPPRRSPFGGRYPMNPGIRLGGGVLEQGQAPADPLQALLMKLQGGG